MPTASPIRSTIAGASKATGIRWLGSAIRPNVARTAVRASSSGMPAATSAPNASTRMSSVIGSESAPALPRSLLYAVSTPFWALA